MNSSFYMFFLYILGIAILTGVIHEFGHWISARFYGYNPRFSFEKLAPTVKYCYTKDYKSRVLIALSGSVPLFIFGLSLLPSGSVYVLTLKCISMAHILSLAPWSADGEIFWASIIRLVLDKKGGGENSIEDRGGIES